MRVFDPVHANEVRIEEGCQEAALRGGAEIEGAVTVGPNICRLPERPSTLETHLEEVEHVQTNTGQNGRFEGQKRICETNQRV